MMKDIRKNKETSEFSKTKGNKTSSLLEIAVH